MIFNHSKGSVIEFNCCSIDSDDTFPAITYDERQLSSFMRLIYHFWCIPALMMTIKAFLLHSHHFSSTKDPFKPGVPYYVSASTTESFASWRAELQRNMLLLAQHDRSTVSAIHSNVCDRLV